MLTYVNILVKNLKESLKESIELRKRKKIKIVGRASRLSTEMFDLSNQRANSVIPTKVGIYLYPVIPMKPVLDLIGEWESIIILII